jgi:hypothetical protein
MFSGIYAGSLLFVYLPVMNGIEDPVILPDVLFPLLIDKLMSL